MRANHLEDYYTFLRFPSVSTDDEYAEKVTECAHWLVEKLTGIGLETKLGSDAGPSGCLGEKQTSTRPPHRHDLWPL